MREIIESHIKSDQKDIKKQIRLEENNISMHIVHQHGNYNDEPPLVGLVTVRYLQLMLETTLQHTPLNTSYKNRENRKGGEH